MIRRIALPALLLCSLVAVGLLYAARLIISQTPHRWSDAATWGGHLPKIGDDITIPAGRVVVLDTNPPPLRSLTVNGALKIADRGITLTVDELAVHGLFEAGTSAAPLRRRCTIVLGGPGGLPGISAAKRIDILGGRIELHGNVHGPSWTKLAQTCAANSRSFVVDSDVHWQPGDRLVVASTDFQAAHAEEVQVVSVTGRTIEICDPLKHAHWGGIASGVDESAEVGLLSRNIAIRGDASSASDQIGGQLMVMHGSSAHIEGVSFESMGRVGELGRYPLHFHLAGDMAGSYVRSCSFSKCYNRCLTIHGTENLDVSSNVAYDTIGHCYFMEDGVETGNRIIGNLGVLTRAAAKDRAILASDTTPATFWITNPDNVVRGNAAAGSDGYGFWYDLPEHPTGPSRTAWTDRNIWPRRTALREFADNVAHSNAIYGLDVDNGPNPPGVTSTPNYDPKRVANPHDARGSEPAPAVFERLTAYKNRKRGAWLRGSWLTLDNAVLADNCSGVALASSQSQIRNSMIVGETINAGTPDPGERVAASGRCLPKPDDPTYPLTGFELYDGLVRASHVTFENFRDDGDRPAGAIGYLRFTPWFVDPRNVVTGAVFVNANRVHFDSVSKRPLETAIGDGYRTAGFVDGDGSVTGRPGSEVAIASPLLTDAGAMREKGWNAVVSTQPLARLFIDNRDTQPKAVAPVLVSRVGATGDSVTLWGSPSSGATTSFQSNVQVDKGYQASFRHALPGKFRVTLRFARPGEWIAVTLPVAAGTYAVSEDEYGNKPAEQCTNTKALAGRGACCYLAGTHGLTLKLVTPAVSADDSVCLFVTRNVHATGRSQLTIN